MYLLVNKYLILAFFLLIKFYYEKNNVYILQENSLILVLSKVIFVSYEE